MKQSIIIVTHIDYRLWLDNLMKTIKTTFDIKVVCNSHENNLFCSAAFIEAFKLDLDEFFVLNDTIKVKDNYLFNVLFEENKGKSVFMNKKGQMFLNKYLMKELLQCDISIIKNVKCKRDDVVLENKLHYEYIKRFNPVILDETFIDNNKREKKFGRLNMILENNYLKKYKGCWKKKMIETSEKYKPIDGKELLC